MKKKDDDEASNRDRHDVEEDNRVTEVDGSTVARSPKALTPLLGVLLQRGPTSFPHLALQLYVSFLPVLHQFFLQDTVDYQTNAKDIRTTVPTQFQSQFHTLSLPSLAV